MNLYLQNTRTVHGQINFLKGGQIDGGPAIRNDSVLFLLRDEFLPNFEKFLSVQARDDGGRVIRGNFNAGHDFGNAQLHEAGGKAPIADLKTF
jgi:hypothetical protein